MAGSLIKIDEEIVTSAVASVSLLGIDSTYDVYKVFFQNVTPDTDSVGLRMRVTKSGTPDTTANYDSARYFLRAYGAFGSGVVTNATDFAFYGAGTQTGEFGNGLFTLFNFNNASEYSFWTVEVTATDNVSGRHNSSTGGAVHTVASASDGVQFLMNSGNIATGRFVLYGLKK